MSGGPDSVALLLLAHAALGPRCSAATVDHGLRPEAAAEARFVASLCDRLGVRHAVLSGPLPERTGGSANLSARARALRYGLLQAQAERDDAVIATAHHADDQRETVLLRLNRGAGVAGLAGVRTSGGRVVRPLLGWRRAELAALVVAAGIAPVDDPSNADDRFDRARLRKRLVEVDWLDPVAVAASAAALAEADAALAWSAQRLATERIADLSDHGSPGGSTGVTLDWGGLPAELRRRLVRACLVRLDPAAQPDGPALTRTIAALDAGRAATLGRALIRPVPDADRVWRFTLAPPRRAR